MSDTSSCPNDPQHVGDRQVDVLTGFVLRSELGTSQPSDDVWSRLQMQLIAGEAPPAAPPLAMRPLVMPMSLRVQQMLLTTVPRLSSVGAALALFVMFVNSSLGLLNPGVFSGASEQIIHPADSVAFVEQKLNDHNPPSEHRDEWYDQPIIIMYGPPAAANAGPSAALPADDPTTLAPPQSISPNELPIWSGLPSERSYRYVGKDQR
jgi:hypothetical protein